MKEETTWFELVYGEPFSGDDLLVVEALVGFLMGAWKNNMASAT